MCLARVGRWLPWPWQGVEGGGKKGFSVGWGWGSDKWTVSCPCPIGVGSSPCPWSDFPVPRRVLQIASGPGCEEGTSLGAVSFFPLPPGKEVSYSKNFLSRCSEGELAREAMRTGHGGHGEGAAPGVCDRPGVELGAGVSWSESMQRYLADTYGTYHMHGPVLSPLQESICVILTTTLEVALIFIHIYK